MIRVLVTVLAVAAVPAPAMAQSIGPDLIVGAFYSGVYDWGSSGNVAAFSIGSQACNVGDQPAAWVSGNNQHPVTLLRRHSDGDSATLQAWALRLDLDVTLRLHV